MLSNIIYRVTLGSNVSQSVPENDRHNHPGIAALTPTPTPAQQRRVSGNLTHPATSLATHSSGSTNGSR
jgi:hypothetical protein